MNEKMAAPVFSDTRRRPLSTSEYVPINSSSQLHYGRIMTSSSAARLLRFGGSAPLAENSDVSVLLLEAGGSDDVPNVMKPSNGL